MLKDPFCDRSLSPLPKNREGAAQSWSSQGTPSLPSNAHTSTAFYPQKWAKRLHRSSSISLQLQFKNKSSLSSAYCRHRVLMHYIRSGKCGHLEYKKKRHQMELGIGSKPKKWQSLLQMAAQRGTSWLDTVDTGSSCRVKGKTKKFLEEKITHGFMPAPTGMDRRPREGHLWSDHRYLSICRKRLSASRSSPLQELPIWSKLKQFDPRQTVIDYLNLFSL